MKKEPNLIDIINKKSNNTFRTIMDSKRDGYIYDAQIEAAKEVVSALSRKTTRSHHTVLAAKMQSGKSGTCNAIVNILTQTKLDIYLGIDRYLFISGMNDCGLKSQTYERVLQQVIGANRDNTYIGRHSKRNLSSNRFFVMKNSDLMSYQEELSNSIIFIDESHYGSNEHNVLTKFLNKFNIDWRNPLDLIKRNIYIVSVSATPFSEVVSDKAVCKKMIELKTDDEYIGVTDYIKSGLVFDAEKNDVKDGIIFDYISDASHRMKENDVNGIIFIRTRNFDYILENKDIVKDFDIFELRCINTTTLEYSKLNAKMSELIAQNEFNKRMKNITLSNGKKPSLIKTKPLIVLMKGAFRAGITLPSQFKDYIYMVYDYSLKSETTAQAMLGRMCGYRHNGSDFKNTYFYINKKFADMYSDWSEDMQNREKIPYNKAKWSWVDEDFEGETKIGSKSCGNIVIDLSEEEITNIYNALKGKKNKLSIMEIIFPHIIKEKGINIPYDYMEEVLMKGKNNYKKSSQDRRFNSFTKDLLVYPFRAEKIKKFCEDTNRDYLTRDDLGKRCISLVLDAEIYKNDNDSIDIKGNKRLLVYYAEVGQKALMASRDGMYQVHKDTSLIYKKIKNIFKKV